MNMNTMMGGGMNMNMNMMGGGMNMPMGFNMPNMMGMNMGMMNSVEEEWMKGFQMGLNSENNSGSNNDPEENAPGPKINVLFTTTIGTKRNIVLSHGTTIDQALRKYLNSVGVPELYGQTEKVSFLFNARKLNFGDTTLVEEFFRNVTNPKVVVNDTQNLIGA